MPNKIENASQATTWDTPNSFYHLDIVLWEPLENIVTNYFSYLFLYQFVYQFKDFQKYTYYYHHIIQVE